MWIKQQKEARLSVFDAVEVLNGLMEAGEPKRALSLAT
jgi:hypothetical protein